MDVSIRRAEQADFAEICRLDAAAFGITYTEEIQADALLVVDLDRFWVATQQDRIVGVTGDFALTMTTVGGGFVDVPGVTWVSVSPTHRRQGVLRQLIHHQLQHFADRGEAMAILTASEGGIYRRFGYGAATQVRRTVIDRSRAELNAPMTTGSVELATAAQARARVPDIHRRWRERVPGAISRDAGRWDVHFLDREAERGGMTAKNYLLHPDGYVIYRIRENWGDGHPRHTCWITDFAAVTAQAHAELWQVLLGLDLVGSIESHQIPLDDPLPQLLNDPRQVRTTAVNDGVWVRPLDVAATLSARRYGIEIDTVIGVHDPLLGEGNFAVRGGPEGAECIRTDRVAEISMTADALGSAYLGGMRLGLLAAAGRVHADDAALLRRLDLAFLGDRAPFHGTAF